MFICTYTHTYVRKKLLPLYFPHPVTLGRCLRLPPRLSVSGTFRPSLPLSLLLSQGHGLQSGSAVLVGRPSWLGDVS